LVVIYGIIIWAVFAFLAKPLSSIFGEDFEQIARVLPVLGALPLLRAVADYGAEIFMASDRPSIQAMTQTFATVLRISFGFFLISNFALEGAVITALSVNAITAIVLWSLAWKLSREQK
jgi:O-antigen/teichoic acid export membrane protein